MPAEREGCVAIAATAGYCFHLRGTTAAGPRGKTKEQSIRASRSDDASKEKKAPPKNRPHTLPPSTGSVGAGDIKLADGGPVQRKVNTVEQSVNVCEASRIAPPPQIRGLSAKKSNTLQGKSRQPAARLRGAAGAAAYVARTSYPSGRRRRGINNFRNHIRGGRFTDAVMLARREPRGRRGCKGKRVRLQREKG